MGYRQKVSTPQSLGLVDARCRRPECKLLLARLRLDGNSQVEIKCRRCQAVSTFASDNSTVRLKPDGQGGYVEVPIGDSRLDKL